MRSLLRAFMVLAALFALAACEQHGPYHVPMTKEKFQRWEAPGRFGFAVGGPQNLYWIDNDRVLHVAANIGESDDRATLRIWTPSTGKVEVLGPTVGNLCYFQGYVEYQERRQGHETIIRHGRLGEPLQTIVDSGKRHQEMREKGYLRHPFNCRYYDASPFAPDEYCKVPLLEGPGYVETQGACSQEIRDQRRSIKESSLPDEAKNKQLGELRGELARRHVRYFPHPDASPVVLPIEGNEINPFGHGLSYLQWKGSYVLRQIQPKGQPPHIMESVWPVDQAHNIYLLSANGEFDVVAIPVTRKFIGRPAAALLTRAGVVARMHGFTRDKKQSVLGLVLYRDGMPERLDDGSTSQMALSPDGCRVAYETSPTILEREPGWVSKLRVVDLCRR